MRVGIITQARMTSERLPGKVMLPLGEGTVLSTHVDRLNESELPVFLAFADSEADRPLWDWAEKEGLNYHKGSTDDVLQRYHETAKRFELEAVVRVTSDCPLVDGKLIRQAVDNFLDWNDTGIYYSNAIKRTFPRGFDFEVFSRESLEMAFEEATEKFQREHVTPYVRDMTEHRHFRRKEDASEYRLTLDEAKDYELMTQITKEYSAHKLSADEIIEVMKAHPELAAINAEVEQKKIN